MEESRDQPGPALERPAASEATLARRLRAVERALGGIAEIEFEPGHGRAGSDDPEAVEERLDALCRAVRAIGECLDARDRARRTGSGIESVRRAVEALPAAGDATAKPDGDGGLLGATRPDVTKIDGEGIGVTRSETGDEEVASAPDESTTEWLDRVAAGGVAPPSVE